MARRNLLCGVAKANRRTDTDKVEKSLNEFDSSRKSAVSDESAVRAEAERWLNYKHELPKRLEAMRASYDTVKAFDIDQATTPVHKAVVDWPAKRDDLQTRVDSLKKLQTDGEHVWDSSAPLRSAAEANKLAASKSRNASDWREARNLTVIGDLRVPGPGLTSRVSKCDNSGGGPSPRHHRH